MAARTQVVNPDPYCDVDTELITMAGKQSNKMVVRLRDPETKQMVALDTLGAIHNADTYALITNRRLQQASHDIMTRSRLHFEPLPAVTGSKSDPVIWDGKRYIARFYTRDVASDIQPIDGGPQHRIMLGMQITNSYDGSLGCAMEFFMMNMLCANQFYSGHMITGFNLKHYRRSDNDIEFELDDAVKAIEQQADQFGRLLPKFAQLTGMPVGATVAGSDKKDRYVDSLSGFLDFRHRLGNSWKSSFDPYLLDELSGHGVSSRVQGIGSASGHRTMWDLLNTYTAVCTHQIGGFSGISINRIVTDTALAMLPSAKAA